MLLRLALAAVGLLAGTGLLAFGLQRRLIYFPERSSEAASLTRAARLGLAPWRGRDGLLRGWRASPPGTPRARVLVLHGNAGSALDRAYYAAALLPHGLDVALLEYPGYGPRPGSPSEETLAAAAVEALEAHAAEGPAPTWVLGESLGSGVAARAARLRPALARHLILVTPFARLSEVARRHYPFLPAFVLWERWAPADDLAAFHGRAAVVLAGRDEVVTAEQGRRLFECLLGAKRLWEQPQAAHNTLDLGPEAPMWEQIVAFLDMPSR